MFATIWEELGGRGIGILLGFLVGSLSTWIIARWKRMKERRSIMKGDARDTVVIQMHIIETRDQPGAEGQAARKVSALRIRSVGQSELYRVVPNGHLAEILLKRAFKVTDWDTLISMEGPEGSYLLETLTNWVCDRVSNRPFAHDLYVMAPCCEPAGLAEHQPITVLLISVSDLALFENWTECRDVQVEHGGDGARVLTLIEMARRFKQEQAKIAQLRASGQRTRYVESMYILDLALDRRSVAIPIKPIPWGRFETVLKRMNVE